MRKRGTAKVVFRVTLIAVIAAATVLGFLQFRRINQAAESEEGQLRRGLALSVSRSVENAFNEVIILVSMMYLEPEAIASRNWSALQEGVEAWKNEALYAGLLKGVYLLSSDASQKPLGIYPGGDAGETGLPAAITGRIIEEIEKNPSRDRPPDFARELMGKGIILLFVPQNVDASTKSPEPPGSAEALVVHIDLDVLYGSLIPAHIEKVLPGYPFRILSSQSGEMLAVSSAPLPGGSPELSVPLAGMPMGSMRLFNTFWNPPKEGEPGFPHLAVGRWLRRLGSGDMGRPAGEREGVEFTQAYRLEVYYPGGSPANHLTARRAINLMMSIGIIVLMVGSLITLYGLYVRTGRLRTREKEFITSVSHELRMPITVIQTASDNLVQGIISEPERVNRYGRIIKREIGRLANMVEGILYYSGLQGGQRSQTLTGEIDLPEMIEEIVDSVEGLTRPAGCTVGVDS